MFGTKENIINAFYENRNKLLYLTELEQQVIDAPKTLVLPSKAEFTVLDITQPKPLFLKYKDGFYDVHKTNEDDLSHYEQFAKLIIDGLLIPCEENKKAGSDILTKYIYSQNVQIDDNCLNDIEKFKNDAAKKNAKLRRKENNYKEAYTYLVTKYQLKAKEIIEKYSHQQICNCLVKLNVTDKFIINYFWNEFVIKVNELDLSAKVLSKCKDGEYEFFGHKYNLVDAKLIEDDLHEKEIEKKFIKYNLGYEKLIEDNLDEKEIEKKIIKYQSKNKKGIISIGKCDKDNLKGECRVIVNTASIDLYKDNTKVTYAFKNINDENNKSTKNTLFECSIINIIEIYKETDKTYKVLINY